MGRRGAKCQESVHFALTSEINGALIGNEAYAFGALVKARDAAEVVQADTLMGKITQLKQDARRLEKKAEQVGNFGS